jgi:hypothetical protein
MFVCLSLLKLFAKKIKKKDQKKGFFISVLDKSLSYSYVSPSAMEKSKLRSSLVENVCVLIDFICEKWFVHAWTKKV